MSKIIIVTERGSSVKGTGHFFRSLSILENYKKINSYIFLNNSNNNRAIVNNLKFNFIFYKNIKHISFKQFLDKDYILIIDLYSPKKLLNNQIDKYFKKIIIFDDLDKLKNVNYNLIKPQEIYKEKFIKKNKFLYYCGTNFFLIKKQFLIIRKKYYIRKKVKNILIFLGGKTSKKNIEIVSNFLSDILYEYSISLIIGFDEIKNIKINRNIKMISMNNNFSKILPKYDLCFIAGSFVKFELMTIGIPFFYIPLNHHQKVLSKKFSKIKCGFYLSDVENLNFNKNQLEKKNNEFYK